MKIDRNRIVGMFLGVAIGDALGAPVESFDAAKINKLYGRVEGYVDFDNSKYLKGSPIGMVTDDTQLTMAVMESIIDCGGVDIPSIARWHIKAFNEGPVGWGGSTRDSVRRLIQGVSVDKAGITDNPSQGMGNGVAMKASPFAALDALAGTSYKDTMEQFTLLTHHTNMAVASGAAMSEALRYLLVEKQFDALGFATAIYYAAEWGNSKGVVKTQDDIVDRLQRLYYHDKYGTAEEIVTFCNGGGPYVYQSLPQSFLFFMNNPNSFDVVLDTVNAGGDVDTTGSMVAAMLGALNGVDIFPKHLVEQLPIAPQMIELAGHFYDRFI